MSGCTASMKPPMPVFQAATRSDATDPRGTLTASFASLHQPAAGERAEAEYRLRKRAAPFADQLPL